MDYKLLLPHKCKLIGWCILIPATILGLILSFTRFGGLEVKAKVFTIVDEQIMGESQPFTFIETNITNTVIGVLFIVGAMFVAFSKEKNEDEFIARLRLSSLLWAVWVNYILLLISFLFLYRLAFLNVMVYNMFTVLIIFIGRFNYILYKSGKPVSDEE